MAKKNGDKMVPIFVAVTMGIVLFLIIHTQYGVWKECRANNSFFYCLNLISR